MTSINLKKMFWTLNRNIPKVAQVLRVKFIKIRLNFMIFRALFFFNFISSKDDI